jgi:hypothetical protein
MSARAIRLGGTPGLGKISATLSIRPSFVRRPDGLTPRRREVSVKYVLLIHLDEALYDNLSPQETERLVGDYQALTKQLKAAGCYIANQRLRPTASATTIRVRRGETLVSDGPFAETKEQLGGFYLIHANDLDEAIAWAAKVPSAKHGGIEVRPVWE